MRSRLPCTTRCANPIGDDAAAQSAQFAESVEVLGALGDLPLFLHLNRGKGMPTSAEQDRVRAMKGRAVEHVRFRSVCVHNDVAHSARLLRMRSIVHDRMQCTQGWNTRVLFSDRLSTWDLAQEPGSASAALPAMSPQAFIEDAHHRSLWVAQFKTEHPLGRACLRRQYSILLSELPDCVHAKVDAEQLATEEGVSWALIQLISLHSGEVVELDPQRTIWYLCRKSPGPVSVEWRNEQWNCVEHGGARRRPCRRLRRVRVRQAQ